MIYIDVDSVVADFLAWVYKVNPNIKDLCGKEIYQLMDDNADRCFLDSPKMPQFDYFMNMYKTQHNVRFLTSVGNHWSTPEKKEQAIQNKYTWLTQYDVYKQDIIIVESSDEKLEYCQNPDDVLYDDKKDTVRKWNQKGGIAHLVYCERLFDEKWW